MTVPDDIPIVEACEPGVMLELFVVIMPDASREAAERAIGFLDPLVPLAGSLLAGRHETDLALEPGPAGPGFWASFGLEVRGFESTEFFTSVLAEVARTINRFTFAAEGGRVAEIHHVTAVPLVSEDRVPDSIRDAPKGRQLQTVQSMTWADGSWLIAIDSVDATEEFLDRVRLIVEGANNELEDQPGFEEVPFVIAYSVVRPTDSGIVRQRFEIELGDYAELLFDEVCSLLERLNPPEGAEGPCVLGASLMVPAEE